MDNATVDKSVLVGNVKDTSISGTGVVHGKGLLDESSVPVKITDVLYIPELVCNLI